MRGDDDPAHPCGQNVDPRPNGVRLSSLDVAVQNIHTVEVSPAASRWTRRAAHRHPCVRWYLRLRLAVELRLGAPFLTGGGEAGEMRHAVARPDDGVQEPVIAWLNAVVAQVFAHEINVFLGAFDGDQADIQSAAAAKHARRARSRDPSRHRVQPRSGCRGRCRCCRRKYSSSGTSCRAEHRNLVQPPDLAGITAPLILA